MNLQFRIPLLVCALGLLLIGWRSWREAPSPLPAARPFTYQVRSATRPNRLGDILFTCQTQFCLQQNRESDAIIGMQTGYVYIGWTNVAQGRPSAKVVPPKK